MFTPLPFPLPLFLWKWRTCHECQIPYRFVDPLVHMFSFGTCCSHECLVERTLDRLQEAIYDTDDDSVDS